jgi:Domain of unknown function (DUF4349)
MRPIRSLLSLIAVAALVVACGSSASAPLTTVGGAVDGSGTGAAVPAARSGQGGAAVGAPAPNPAQGQGSTGQVAAVDDAKIIRTGSMALEVTDLTSALRVARDAIVGLGGYVGASSTSSQGDKPSADITYRIPADKWEPALDALRSLNGLTAKVDTEHTDAIEVTGQVVDLQARIANLQASEIALQGIAAKATKISDVLEVQAQLTTTRGQIEELTAQLKDLNDRAGYATLTVQYNVPVLAVQAAAKGWEPATVVDEAAATMVAVLQNLATAGIWFLIVWLPILLVLGALTLIAIWIARRLGVGRRGSGAVPPAPIVGEG